MTVNLEIYIDNAFSEHNNTKPHSDTDISSRPTYSKIIEFTKQPNGKIIQEYETVDAELELIKTLIEHVKLNVYQLLNYTGMPDELMFDTLNNLIERTKIERCNPEIKEDSKDPNIIYSYVYAIPD